MADEWDDLDRTLAVELRDGEFRYAFERAKSAHVWCVSRWWRVGRTRTL